MIRMAKTPPQAAKLLDLRIKGSIEAARLVKRLKQLEKLGVYVEVKTGPS